MNDNEFDVAARAWLNDGPTRMSDRAVLSALDEIHTTRQRRAPWLARRATPVSIVAGGAIAAVLVVAIGVVAINVVPRQPNGSSVGSPSPSPSPAHAVAFPDLTKTFTSPTNGFSVKVPDRVAITPAKQLWGFSKQADEGFDVVETGLAAVFKGTSRQFTDEGNVDEQIDTFVMDDSVLPGGCHVPRGSQAEIAIDGKSGRIAQCAIHIEATVIDAGRLYLFTLSADRPDARAVFDALVATIDLTPETAIDFPAMTTIFVSPTYGYSFKYHDRGGLAPATELWDPGNQPIGDRNFDHRFDAVETGLAAYFEAASAAIPDGVSIDAWVDEYVTPLAAGGCGLPRSRQAGITIDGQPGRIAECDHTEATVVAGGRLYLFIGPGQSSRNKAWFEAWIATVDLRPEDAAVPSSTPSS